MNDPIVFQSTKLFSGDYAQSHMTYERRWPREPEEVPRRSRNIEEPTYLPTRAPALPPLLPMPAMPAMPPPPTPPPPPPVPLPQNEQRGFIRRNIGNLFGLSQQPANHPPTPPSPQPAPQIPQELPQNLQRRPAPQIPQAPPQNFQREVPDPQPQPNPRGDPPEIRRITRNRRGKIIEMMKEEPPEWWQETDIYLKVLLIFFFKSFYS